MKMSRLLKNGLALCAGATLLAGCAGGYVEAGPGDVYVDSAPPPLIDEPIPVAPGPGYVWLGGSWGWDGGRWGWNHGHWERPPQAGMHYEAPRYAYRGGHHVYHAGGWRK